jgi:hypothetical protein
MPPSRGRRDVARRVIEAVYAFADGFGPASVYWPIQEHNAARSLYDTLRPSDIFRRLPALSLAGRFRGVRPLGRSAALRPAEIAVFCRLPPGPLVHAASRVSRAESL